ESEPADIVAQRLAGALLPARASIVGKGSRASMESVEVERAAPWCGAIAHAALAIAGELPARLEGGGLAALYRDVELPCARLLAHVERIGVCVDVAHFARLSVDVEQ